MRFKRVFLLFVVFSLLILNLFTILARPLFAQTSAGNPGGSDPCAGAGPSCEFDSFSTWQDAYNEWVACGYCSLEPKYAPPCNGVNCDNGSTTSSSTSGSSTTSSSSSGGPTNTPAPTHTPVPTNTPTPTFTPTPTPTPVPLSWIKIHNGSFTSKGDLDNSIPPSVSSCDAADDGTRYFINGTAGVASANNINLGTAPVSSNDWKSTGYTKQAVLTASTFVEYLKARKTYQTITDLASITADGLYVWSGAFPDIASVPAQFNNYNVVLIVPSSVTINMANFNPSKSVAILAQSLTFSPTTLRATGIFVADTVDTGTTANSGLTITGNLIATTTLTHDREYASPGCPTLFIDFKAAPYMDLLPYLSVAKYEWRQLQ